MYIQSLGTDPRLARDVALSFAQSQASRDVQEASSNTAVYNDGEEQCNSDLDISERALMAGSERPQAEILSRSSMIGQTVSAVPNHTTPRHRTRIFWPRFETPGAVQMHTRAFGAPFRSEPSPAGDIEQGSTSNTVASREMVLEARAVSDDEKESRGQRASTLPVVYAEKLSFASWARQHSLFRGVMVLLAFTIAAVIATVLAVLLTNDDSSNVNATGTSGGSPSAAPTFISSEFIQALESVSGYEALSKPGSPQRRAIWWLSSVDQSGMESTDSGLLQRYILIVLYFATEGEQWIEREQWLDASLHECQWGSAITCKTDPSGRQIVTGLDL